jgi:hypothetical protein
LPWQESLTPRSVMLYHVEMNLNDELMFWMRREIEDRRQSIVAMESGQLQIRRRNNDEWIDTTFTVKPDLQEGMWQLEKLLKLIAANGSRAPR